MPTIQGMTSQINIEYTNLRYVTIDSVYPQYLGMTLCMGMDGRQFSIVCNSLFRRINVT